MIESPCKKKCALDETLAYCVSCLRSLDEIKNWEQYSDREKILVKISLVIREEMMRK